MIITDYYEREFWKQVFLVMLQRGWSTFDAAGHANAGVEALRKTYEPA